MTFTPINWVMSDIITKVRNITGTPISDNGTSELSDQQVANYINSYYAFTMPFELKEQINFQPINFNTFANQDVYDFPGNGSFLTDQPMAYCNGFPLNFYTDRDIFFQDWPQQFTTDNVATGNNTVGPYTGTTQAFPVIAGTFNITDGSQVLSDIGQNVTNELIATGTGVAAYNGILNFKPIDPGTLQISDGVEFFGDNGLGVLTGSLGGTGTIVYATGVWTAIFNTAVIAGTQIFANYSLPNTSGILGGNGSGTINYVTGAFSATFTAAVATTLTIYDNYQAYQPARPQGILYYNNTFTFRPIPDQVYEVTLQGYATQTQILTDSSVPLQTEWGQLLAYGASVEVFADRGDMVASNNTYAFLKRYENVALNRFVQQLDSSQSVPRF